MITRICKQRFGARMVVTWPSIAVGLGLAVYLAHCFLHSGGYEARQSISSEVLKVAQGEPRLDEKPYRLVEISEASTLPFWPKGLALPGNGWRGSLTPFLKQHRGLAAIIGATILMLSFFFLRLTAALAMGCTGALLAWHGAVLCDLKGFITLPEDALPAVALLGFALGALLGLRRRSLLGYVTQRLALIFVLQAFACEIAAQFGWPVTLTHTVAILGTIISPVIGQWLLASYFLALGLDAHGTGSYLILGAAGMAVHVLNRGTWIPGRRFPGARGSRKWAKTENHEVSLGELVDE